MNLFQLIGTIAINNSNANNQIEQTTGKAEGLSSKLKSGIGTVAKWGTAIVGGATVAGAALVGLATKAASGADRVDKLSQKIGVSRTAFQELDFICSQSGTAVETLQAGMKSLTLAMDGAKNGTASNVEQFQKLGVSVTNADGSFRSQEDVLFDTISALQGMNDQTEKARLATELFGRSGTELMPLLNGEAGSIEEMKQKAHELGLVLDDELIDNGVKLTDSLDQTKRAFQSIGIQLGGALMPIVKNASDYIQQALPTIQALIGKLSPVITSLLDGILPPLMDLGEKIFPVLISLIEALAPPIIQVVQSVLPIITQLIQIITLLVNTIVTFLMPVIVALATMLGDVLGVAFNVIADIVKLVVAVITGDWETAKETLSAIWTSIIEIGESLWGGLKNFFDTLMNTLQTSFSTVWDAIKTALSNVWTAIKTVAETVFNAIKSTITTILDGIKTTFTSVWNGIKSAVTTVIDSIKSGITSGLNAIKSSVTSVLNGIKSAFTSVFNGIKNFLSPIINWLKGIFNFNWSLPKIKLPHFSLTGRFSLAPPSIPHFSVEWYKKAMDDGMIMNQPTIFGYDDATNKFLAGGEAGSETVVGTQNLMEMIQTAINSENNVMIRSFTRLVNLLEDFFPQVLESMNYQLVLDTGVLVAETAPAMDEELGKIYKKKGRQ